MPVDMNLGKILGQQKGTSMRFRGKWNDSSEYLNTEDYIDLTESEGSLWVCQLTNIGVQPAEGEYWSLAAQGVASDAIDSLRSEVAENRTSIDNLNKNVTDMQASLNTLTEDYEKTAAECTAVSTDYNKALGKVGIRCGSVNVTFASGVGTFKFSDPTLTKGIRVFGWLRNSNTYIISSCYYANGEVTLRMRGIKDNTDYNGTIVVDYFAIGGFE